MSSDRRQTSHGRSPWWAAGFWAALLAGIVVAWSPRYWPVSVAVTGISIVTICWIAFSLLAPLGSTEPRDLELSDRPDFSQTGLSRTGFGRGRTGQTVLVALIGAWGFLQIALHTTLLPQLTLESSIIWAIAAAAFVIGSQILRGRASRELFLELTLWSVTALAIVAMLQLYGASGRVFGIFPVPPTVMGTFQSHNRFAALMELAAPIALWHMVERNAITGGLCYAMILAATITDTSRAGVLLVGAELMIFLGIVLFGRRREAKSIAFIFTGLAALVLVASIVAGTDRIKAKFEDKDPFLVRRELLYSTLKLIGERPWTGYGMGTWRAVYPHAATYDLNLIANEAHNDWAQWTADGGIPFLLLMATLVIRIAKPAAQSIWGLGLLSVMIHSWVDFPLREPVLLFLWFALAGAVAQSDAGNSRRGNARRASG